MRKAIQLSPRIRYLPLEDEEGEIGVMFLMPGGKDEEKARVVSIVDREDFKFFFNEFRVKEDRQYLWGLFNEEKIGSSEGNGC
jgi:hypothetical protein